MDDVSIGGRAVSRRAALRVTLTGAAAIASAAVAAAMPRLAGAATPGPQAAPAFIAPSSGSFAAAVHRPVGAAPFALTSGDFTGNGKADVVVANVGDNTVSILLGKGNGAFDTHATYGVGKTPVALALGDFTGDGKPDLAVVNSEVRGTVSVLLMQAAGRSGRPPHLRSERRRPPSRSGTSTATAKAISPSRTPMTTP